MALNTAKSRAEIHAQMIPPMTIFPKNPTKVTSLGALSRSFKSGFFVMGSGLAVGGIPPRGAIVLGSKVVEFSIKFKVI